ncbi:MAG: hypothetical protein CTY31_04645 [Hyphomicrobium sp.]|nr:MAG: hypothetical protein CTY39_05760 [Hyphomicrobium sp.]PPD00427.1 MAG: hypothetical protein CTY31_04645 [Hyphomicrobium sp.]
MNYREMHQLAQNPAGVRSLASNLRTLLGTAISDKEADFLGKLERFTEHGHLSVRQQEFLWSIREKTSRKSIQGKYRASTLVKHLWEARCDLPYEHEENLEILVALGDGLRLSHSQWRWIFQLCRELNLIEDEYIPLT